MKIGQLLTRWFFCLVIAGAVTLGAVFIFPVLIALLDVYFANRGMDPGNVQAVKAMIFKGYLVFVFIVSFFVTDRIWGKVIC